MAGELNGVRVAFLVANEGVEQVELIEPLRAGKRCWWRRGDRGT